MPGRLPTRAGAVAAALAQTAAGLGAHALAAGCPPTARSLAALVPAAVLAVLLVGRVLPHRPLLRLAGGQLAVHAVLGLAVCTGAVHAHAAPPLMTAAHLAALVLCRAVLDRVVALAEDAATRLGRLVPRAPRPVVLVVPDAAPVRAVAAAPAPCRDVVAHAPRRGPPAPERLLLPV